MPAVQRTPPISKKKHNTRSRGPAGGLSVGQGGADGGVGVIGGTSGSNQSVSSLGQSPPGSPSTTPVTTQPPRNGQMSVSGAVIRSGGGASANQLGGAAGTSRADFGDDTSGFGQRSDPLPRLSSPSQDGQELVTVTVGGIEVELPRHAAKAFWDREESAKQRDALMAQQQARLNETLQMSKEASEAAEQRAQDLALMRDRYAALENQLRSTSVPKTNGKCLEPA